LGDTKLEAESQINSTTRCGPDASLGDPPLQWTSKPWGRTAKVAQEPLTYLALTESGYTSEHRHLESSNVFHVITGCIDVEAHDRINGEYAYERLEEGDSLTVPAGVWHRFIVVDPGVMVEVYDNRSMTCVDDDIDRRSESSSEPYTP